MNADCADLFLLDSICAHPRLSAAKIRRVLPFSGNYEKIRFLLNTLIFERKYT